jgi:inosose dehydratase
MDAFVRREQHERALKTLSAGGFHAVEITCGPGRWEPLGNREMIEINHGSLQGFRQFLSDCGIQAVSSFYLDTGAFLSVRTAAPLSPANPADHAEIVELARPYIEMLPELGGDRLIVKAAPAYWRVPDAGDSLIATLSQCWNAVAQLASGSAVQIGLHLDCLAAIRDSTTIGRLLDASDPGRIGLAMDTAELTIAGLDPLALFLEHGRRVNHFHFKDAVAVDELSEFRMQNAELLMLSAGGQREIARWFWEMGTPGGRVDFPGLFEAAQRQGYAGWFVVESDQSPYPATSALLNSWYVRHRLSGEQPTAATG